MVVTIFGKVAEIPPCGPPRAVAAAGRVAVDDGMAGSVSSEFMGEGAFEPVPVSCDSVGSYTEFILKGEGVKGVLELWSTLSCRAGFWAPPAAAAAAFSITLSLGSNFARQSYTPPASHPMVQFEGSPFFGFHTKMREKRRP